ncbi:MAG TPA: SDR family oxidoreductase, partial [Candidatus Limnocylindria bacterium]|nr:SDR family oxidoreductase [Candidatus Limnocylindria bacterium]
MTVNARPQVVVITGASAGVGRALARLYADRGAWVGLIARGRAGLTAARQEVEALGGRGLELPLDVADADAVEAAAERVERELGPIDVWINNAMASVFSPVREMKVEEFRRVTEVTYLGAVHGSLSALRRMQSRDRGTIVLVGSALAYRGIPLQSAYCAAKHAMQGFHDSLRTELMHDGSNVKVTMVQLPAVNTPQFGWVLSRLPNRAQPVPPIFQPEVIAEGIAWAADNPDATRELNIGFPTLKAVWGNKLAPTVADRVLASSGYTSQQ